jgi:transposase
MKKSDPIKFIKFSAEEREAFLAGVQAAISPEEFEVIGELADAVLQLATDLDNKKVSVHRLQGMVFGSKSEKASKRCRNKPPRQARLRRKRPGHGRLAHGRYTGARRVDVPHESLQEGEECPKCRRGKLRRQKQPARTVTLTAQPPVAAVIHEMERLRCDTCGAIYTAKAPSEVIHGKFDPSVGVLVGMMRYGSGMPSHRLARFQESVGVPLPASVQWEQCQRTAQWMEPVFNHLQYLGAQSFLFYNDDTTMRVEEVRKQIQAQRDSKRKGIFTTGIVCEGHSPARIINLFFTGREHAGENLAQLLDKREGGLEKPLQMCDGLSCNHPGNHDTQLCNCLAHARRKFVDIQGVFPGECEQVVEAYGVVYQVESECKMEGVDAIERLRRHQIGSQPALEKLRADFAEATKNRQIEPNSALGKAIGYMETRWEPLTTFLRIPGAPVDNNITERLLKSSILHRKNSLHYRTLNGAKVGDCYMSVIETCRANGVNPMDYMMAVVKNSKAVEEDPDRWMPWNYKNPLNPQSPNTPPPS